jgi:hypothetical protein
VTDEAEEREELPLSTAAQYLLEECRMVLPGMQALFGFQLIVVFSPGFTGKLTVDEQHLHLLAMILIVLAIALVMTPAALHRGMRNREVTATFLRVSARLLLVSMLPLALALCLDFSLIAGIILGVTWASLLALALFAIFVALWFVLPRARRLQRVLGRGTR